MSGVSFVFRVALCFAFAASWAFADDRGPVASWRPDSSDALTLDLDFAEMTLNYGVPELADARLRDLSSSLASFPPDVRERFGRLAVRAALESTRLDSSAAREETRQRIEEIRLAVEGRDFRQDYFEYFGAAETLSDSALRYALALVRAYYELGTLDLADSDASSAPRSDALDASLALSKSLAQSLPAASARPFLYWHAKGTLANLADQDRVATAEKFAAALEKNTRAAQDEYWFFTGVLLIEIARVSGDFELAGNRVKAALRLLEAREAETPALREIAAALVAQEIRLLQAEGKTTEALRQATQDTDLLGAPLPANTKRWNEIFNDPFEDLNLARVELYWRVVPTTATQQELNEREPPMGVVELARETLVEEARRVGALVTSSFGRAQTIKLARSAGETAGDWSAIELAAQEAFLAEDWLSSLADYDRAAQVASDSGDLEEEYRLRCVAAALVDKLLREQKLPAAEDKDAWRADAAERFESLSRERVEAPNASTFMLLALEYRESLNQDDAFARFEYLRLFPTAPNVGAFALDLARRSLEEGALSDARLALDYVANDDPALPAALALERDVFSAALAEASESDRDALLAATLARFYRRASFAPPDASADSIAALAQLLTVPKEWRPAAPDSVVLPAFFEMAFDFGAADSPAFAQVAADALDAWRAATDPREPVRAKIDALRLSLSLLRGDEKAVVSILGESGAGDAVDLATLELTLELAENAAPALRRRLAALVLETLDSSQNATATATLARAEALRLLGRNQESLNLFAAIRKSAPENVDAARGIARLLTGEQNDRALELALSFWSDVAELTPPSSKEWWDAKEETIKLYCRLGKADQAEKIAKTLWLTRDDPSDPGRRARWEREIERSKRP